MCFFLVNHLLRCVKEVSVLVPIMADMGAMPTIACVPCKTKWPVPSPFVLPILKKPIP